MKHRCNKKQNPARKIVQPSSARKVFQNLIITIRISMIL